MALAAWCKKNGLQDQWRAHLSNVLVLNPDHKEARALLGYQQASGIWLTAQEIGGTNVRTAAAVAALKKWGPQLLTIRNDLKQSDPKRREAARQRLAAIQDAAAILALELVFCCDTEPMALAGVEKLAEMTVAEASHALVRQAIFSPWDSVRKAAIEKLKIRDRETYVPDLLAAMASPTESRMELFQEPDGRLLFRSGRNPGEAVVLNTRYDNALAPYAGTPYASTASGSGPNSDSPTGAAPSAGMVGVTSTGVSGTSGWGIGWGGPAWVGSGGKTYTYPYPFTYGWVGPGGKTYTYPYTKGVPYVAIGAGGGRGHLDYDPPTAGNDHY